MIIIRESRRYSEIIQFFIENELEFSEDQKQNTDTVIKYWEAVDGEKLVGACLLGMREEEYVLEGIATHPNFRKKRIGERLLSEVLTHLNTLEAKKIFLCARTPGFFRTQGFSTVNRATAPQFECKDCNQFGIKCFPEIMVKNL